MGHFTKHIKKTTPFIFAAFFLFSNSCVLLIEDVDDLDDGTVTTIPIPKWLEVNNFSDAYIVVEYTMDDAPYDNVYLATLAPGEYILQEMPQYANDCNLFINDGYTYYDYDISYYGGTVVDFFNRRADILENVEEY